jgi:hypothetical protein
MTYVERAEQIRLLAASFGADEEERARLKTRADESLDQFHRAVLEFSEMSFATDQSLGPAEPKTHRART